jgi:glycerol-3-phosphate dehydrogenase
VVVIGGGVVGAGVLLDAATRGYDVALLERDDYSSGASGRSAKLIDGSLSQLQNFELGHVRAALLERDLMVRLAPHLVRPLSMIFPSFEGSRLDRWTGIRLNMYDSMSEETRLPRLLRRRGTPRVREAPRDRHRIIDGEEVLQLVPALRGRRPTAAYLYHEASTDDTRLVIAILNQAARFGAVMVNRVGAVTFLPSGRDTSGLEAVDAVTGEHLHIQARHVVNATGAQVGQFFSPDPRATGEPRVVATRGLGVAFAYSDLPLDVGALVPFLDGRKATVLPYYNHTLAVIEDEEHRATDENGPAIAEEELGDLVKSINTFFGTDLPLQAIRGGYTGRGARVEVGGERAGALPPPAGLFEARSGLITICPGRLTMWRRAAEIVVDRLVERDGRVARCRTHEIPLGAPIDIDDLPAVPAIDAETYLWLAARYGNNALDIVRIAQETPELARPVIAGLPCILAEVAYGGRREQVQSVADFVMRRSPLALLAARELQANDSVIGRVAQALGSELNWSAAQTADQISAWQREAATELIVMA